MAVVAMLRPDRLDAAVDLLAAAGESLATAHLARTVAGRSAGTKLAVLRAAAAVLCVRGRTAHSGPVDVWHLLPRVAPELTEWADFFFVVLPEGGARPGVGPAGPMSVREVDDLLRQGEDFVQIVAGALGLPPVRVAGELVPITGAHDLKEMRPGAHDLKEMRQGGGAG